jgi:phytoene desaturase
MNRQVTIIGSGFSSLSAACYLARDGYKVNVYEKNDQLGGRARQLDSNGYKFDMGPTWYWMPDVFERFFSDFDKKPSDFYQLEKLNPAYRIYFDYGKYYDIGSSKESIENLFEKLEPGSLHNLNKYLLKAKKNYDVAIKKLVYKPGLSPLELISKDTIFEGRQFITSIRAEINKQFKHPILRQILEFPVLFLGAKPDDTPSFYSFMNYADLALGTWYPKGGMKAVVSGLVKLAKQLGVNFIKKSEVKKINLDHRNFAQSISIHNQSIPVNILVSGADYKHTETLLDKKFRNYNDKYWNKKVMSPSTLLFYVAFSKKIKNVLHHTLFFDTSFDQHASEIYDTPKWPKDPLFYASFPSKTDSSITQNNHETAIFLIPLAPDLQDTEKLREEYFKKIITRLELLIGDDLLNHIVFKQSYGIDDFKQDYNSFKGNAYGLANTLSQTAFLRPRIKSKKVKNLYFTGQLTVPGPGVPPALISGKIVSQLILKNHAS